MLLFFHLFPIAALLLPFLYFDVNSNLSDRIFQQANRTAILIPMNDQGSAIAKQHWQALTGALLIWVIITASSFLVCLVLFVHELASCCISHCWRRVNQIWFREPLDRSRTVVALYAVWVIIYMPTMLLSFSCFCYLYTYRFDSGDLHDALIETLQTTTEDRHPAWPKVQYTFQCCGVKSYKDYGPYQTPDDSCCKVVNPHCADNALKNMTIASHLHQKGCLDDIVYELNTYFREITFPLQMMSLSAVFILIFVTILLFKYIKRVKSPKKNHPQDEEAPINLDNEESDGSDGNETTETNAEDDELILTDESDLEDMIENESNDTQLIPTEVQVHLENVAENTGRDSILESDDDPLLEP